MNLIKFQRSPLNAWSGTGRLPELQDELERLFTFPLLASNGTAPWVPALDVYEEKDNYVVEVELPGANKDDVKLSLEQGTLTITGERKREAKREGTEAYHCERFQGRFQRTINLPETIAADKVTAQYKDGVLTVTLPKHEAAKPRQIDIKLN
jgi:HSP20 family protein